jgi:hypothetical protein
MTKIVAGTAAKLEEVFSGPAPGTLVETPPGPRWRGAGAIAGAYCGWSAIPGGWLSMMENGARGRDYIGERARRLSEI